MPSCRARVLQLVLPPHNCSHHTATFSTWPPVTFEFEDLNSWSRNTEGRDDSLQGKGIFEIKGEGGPEGGSNIPESHRGPGEAPGIESRIPDPQSSAGRPAFRCLSEATEEKSEAPKGKERKTQMNVPLMARPTTHTVTQGKSLPPPGLSVPIHTEGGWTYDI